MQLFQQATEFTDTLIKDSSMHGAQNYRPIKVPNSNVSKFNEVEELSSRDEKIVDELEEESIFSPIIKNETIRTKPNDIQFTEEIEMRSKESKVQQINIKRTKNSSTVNLISQNKLYDKENTRTQTKRDDNQEQRCISYNKEASDALENSKQLLDSSLTQISTQFVPNKNTTEQHTEENSLVVDSQSTEIICGEIEKDGDQNEPFKIDDNLERGEEALSYYNFECDTICSNDNKVAEKTYKNVSTKLKINIIAV